MKTKVITKYHGNCTALQLNATRHRADIASVVLGFNYEDENALA